LEKEIEARVFLRDPCRIKPVNFPVDSPELILVLGHVDDAIGLIKLRIFFVKFGNGIGEIVN